MTGVSDTGRSGEGIRVELRKRTASMNGRNPRVSIGLPVYNGEKYLERALDCLLKQDYADFELIVSDNASTDATESICREYAAKDSRIRYYRNPANIGASPNYNRVFSLARGEFFKWASHDDECDPSLLRRCLEAFDRAGGAAVLVFSRAEIIDETGRVQLESPDRIGSSSPRPFKRLARVLWSSKYGHSLWGLIRSEALRQTRLLGHIEADHVLLGELALLGETIEIPEVLYRQRRHPDSAIPTHRTARELMAWHDPKMAGSQIFLPHWERVYLEYFKGIRHIPLSAADRLLCAVTVPAVGYGSRFLCWSLPFRTRLGLRRKSMRGSIGKSATADSAGSTSDRGREPSLIRDGAPRSIGLLDHMGYGNLGDAAIQDAVIANIKKRLPNARIIGFSFIPDDTLKRHNIPCYPIRWWYPTLAATEENHGAGRISFGSRLKSALKSTPLVYSWAKPVSDLMHEAVFLVRSYRVLRSLDVLIISGGGQLCELWRGPWSHPYTIFKFSLLTKLARRQLYILNVGAGPLKHPLSKFFARSAVRLADYRSFRDRDSQELVRSIGVKSKTHVYPDLAYALEIGDRSNAADRSNAKLHGASKPTVGLNPIGFCDPRIWPRKEDSLYQEYLGKLTQFSAWLIEHGYTLRVFSTEMSVDRQAIGDLETRLRSRLSPAALEGQFFWNPSESVTDVLREMSELDFIVTSKFHGIIFSHLLGKPVISLSYHRKMDVAMRAVGQSRFSADIEHFDVDSLIQAFRSLVDESRRIQSGSAAAVEANAARLSEQFDGLFGPVTS